LDDFAFEPGYFADVRRPQVPPLFEIHTDECVVVGNEVNEAIDNGVHPLRTGVVTLQDSPELFDGDTECLTGDLVEHLLLVSDVVIEIRFAEPELTGEFSNRGAIESFLPHQEHGPIENFLTAGVFPVRRLVRFFATRRTFNRCRVVH